MLNTRGITRSQSSRHLPPKYQRVYQVTVQSRPPSKIPEVLPAHNPFATSLQNTRGITRSQSSCRLPPKYRRIYQVIVQSPSPSIILEGLPGHCPIATSLQNTGGITRSQSSRPPFTLLPPSKLLECLPGHSPVLPLSHRRLPPKYQRDYQVTIQSPPSTVTW
jgi:hypothetical protein